MPHAPRPPGHWVRHLITFAGIGLVALAATPRHAAAQCANATLTIAPCNPNATVAANLTNQQYVFTFINGLTLQQNVSYSVTCTGYVINCSATPNPLHLVGSGSGNATITYSTTNGSGGTIKISTSTLSSTLTLSVPTHAAPVVTLPYYNNDNVQPSLCQASCFDKVLTYTTPAYFTMTTPRSVTLMYRSNTANPMVTVQVDAQDNSITRPTRMSLKVQRPNGSLVNYTNGSTELYFTFSTSIQPMRLAGQFAPVAPDTLTGAYNYTAIVTSYFADGTALPTSTPLRVLLENERSSVFGAGWTVAGQQKIYPQSNGDVVITDGMGAISYFKLQLSGCTQGCSYISPTGDYTQLTTKTVDQFGRHYDRRYPDGTIYEFLGSGALAGIYDRIGNQAVYWYDSQGRDSLISDPLGTSSAYGIHFIYDGGDGWKVGSIRQIDDPYGRATWFGVNSNNDLVQIEDPMGNQYAPTIPFFLTQNATYNAQHQLIADVDRHQATWHYAYDFAGKLLVDSSTAVLADGTTQPIVNNFQSAERTFLINPSSGLGTSTNWAPFEGGGPWWASLTDAEGNTTSFTLDRWGQPLQINDPANGSTFYGRNGGIPALTTTYPWGGVDSASYNANGLVTRFVPAGRAATTYGYGNNFAVADTIKGPGQTATLTVDAVGNVTQSANNTFKTKYYYNSRGQDTMIVDPGNHTWKNHYDAVFDNLDSTLAPGNRFTKLTFDGYGRTFTSTANGLPVSATYYDALNRVIKTAGGAQVDTTRYSYDSLYLTQVQDAKGQIYKASVNALGWVTQQVDPANHTTSFTYDKNGRVKSYTNRRNQTVNFTYDPLGRPLSKSGTGVMSATYSYSSNRRVIVGANAVSIDTIYIDSTGWQNVVSTTFPAASGAPSFRVRHFANSGALLDSVDVQTSTAIQFGGWAYHYIANSPLMTSVSLPKSASVSYSYDPVGLIDGMNYPGEERIENHLGNRRVYQSQYTTNGTTIDTALNNAFGRNYYFDGVSRITQISDASLAFSDAYTYDSLARVASDASSSLLTCSQVDTAYGISCSGQGGAITVYQAHYDSVGNLTKNGTGVGTYGVGNRLQSMTTSSGDQNATYTTDLDGNVIRRVYAAGPDLRYGWSPDGLLVSDTTGTGMVVQFDYNAFGHLVRRSTNGTPDRYYLWDGDQLLAELNGAASNRITEYAYAGPDNPVALFTGATTLAAVRYIERDETGTVLGVWGSQSKATLQYDLRGQNAALSALADSIRLRWKSLFYMGDSTQLYYARNRWYDPVVGRFISEDPSGTTGGINGYVYANNNYLDGNDPTGLDSWDNNHDGEDCPGDQFTSRGTCTEQSGDPNSGVGFFWVPPAFVVTGETCGIFGCSGYTLSKFLPGYWSLSGLPTADQDPGLSTTIVLVGEHGFGGPGTGSGSQAVFAMLGSNLAPASEMALDQYSRCTGNAITQQLAGAAAVSGVASVGEWVTKALPASEAAWNFGNKFLSVSNLSDVNVVVWGYGALNFGVCATLRHGISFDGITPF